MTYPCDKDTKNDRKHECEICHRKFLGRSDLKKHTLIHTNEKPHVCNECGLTYRQVVSLQNHIASKHSPIGQSKNIHVCEYCKKAFPIKERLKLHLRTHTGERPYQCEYCKKTFARKGQLLQHSVTHTGAKPYICHLCKSSFTTSANLKFHVNRHLEIRDFNCDICGKSFFRKDSLKQHLKCYHDNVRAFHCKVCNKQLKGHLPQHMKTHKQDKPHECSQCDAKFIQKSQLTVHQRIHSGEKPYSCEVCSKTFAHSLGLKLHKRKHTGEKPFQCVLCNTSFIQLPHLKKHMLCIHKRSKPYACKHCKSSYKTKMELERHYHNCKVMQNKPSIDVTIENSDADPPIRMEKMRFLLAILLKKISDPKRLEELGFNKRLIDDILIDSIEHSGRHPCKNEDLPVTEKLKRNVDIFLDWTVPEQYMEKFKKEQRSTEEILEELTFRKTFNR